MNHSLVVIVLVSITLLVGSVATAATIPDPEQLLAKSIAYHDPNGVWERGEIHLNLLTTYSEEFAERAGSREVAAQLWLSPAAESFRYSKNSGDEIVEYSMAGGEGAVTLNGSADISDEDRERLRLREPVLYRDYFEYLYGMPMKLRDPGTIVAPVAKAVQFNGRDSWALRVTYDPEVGEDIWYFYFDQETFALMGYRFYKDESKNDGEYITFEEEVHDQATGLRVPKARAWYFNENDDHLATDDIVSMSVTVP